MKNTLLLAAVLGFATVLLTPIGAVFSATSVALDLTPQTIETYVARGIHLPPDQAKRVLFEAVQSGNPKTVQTVLRSLEKMYRRAKVPQNILQIINAADARGLSPLAYAAISGNTKIAHLLLEYGANPNKKDNFGNTALMHAVLNDHPDLANLLIDYGAGVNEKSSVRINNFRILGGSALMAAVVGGSERCVKQLLALGANVEDVDDSGETALMHAAIEGQETIAKMLIAAGARVDHQDELGRTALMLAIIHRHPSLVKLLLEAGADTQVQDIQRLSARQYAFSLGNKEIQRLISRAMMQPIVAPAATLETSTVR